MTTITLILGLLLSALSTNDETAAASQTNNTEAHTTNQSGRDFILGDDMNP